MARDVFSAELTEMIEQAKNLTDAQAETLGGAWNSEEGLSYDPAQLSLIGTTTSTFMSEIPDIQNLALQYAWQHISSVASLEGRADELDAAIAAEKGVEHRIHHLKIDSAAKGGAVEAARAAVLAVGVRDIIDPAAYELLIGPWEQTFGKS
jgi:hypothetical protein